MYYITLNIGARAFSIPRYGLLKLQTFINTTKEELKAEKVEYRAAYDTGQWGGLPLKSQELGEDAIAIDFQWSDVSEGRLAYSPDYKGKKMNFDYNYFQQFDDLWMAKLEHELDGEPYLVNGKITRS